MAFRFPNVIRTHIFRLADLMSYANSRNDGRWAHQSSDPKYNGVYGLTQDVVKAILIEEYGHDVATMAIDSLNLGGDSSFGLDIENAVAEALERAKP